MTVLMGAMVLTVAAGAAIAPEIDQAAATFNVSSPPSAPVQCTGLDTLQYATVSGVATGTSTESSTGGRFSLTGNVTINLTQTVKINLAGLSDAVSRGKFLLTYPADPAHRLVGTFTALAKVNLGDNSSSGRGFILANYQKKSGRIFKNTGDQLLANTEFTGAAHANASPSVVSGSIGSAAPTVGDYSLKVLSHC
jgi:hypothetical protein